MAREASQRLQSRRRQAQGQKRRGSGRGGVVEEVEDADVDGGGAGGDDDAEEGGVGVGEFGGDVEFVGCYANWEVGKRERPKEEDSGPRAPGGGANLQVLQACWRAAAPSARAKASKKITGTESGKRAEAFRGGEVATAGGQKGGFESEVERARRRWGGRLHGAAMVVGAVADVRRHN
ncbi:hypothetical protein C1H46_019820 [Malus baccata]|uniref:Uncharacterized protein n=1 Tax=Malus baccata TaxID=106549 RepID=A0A540M795_MALBA|nr:hypothetical protein C1H46_019820 [Malus baccata]